MVYCGKPSKGCSNCRERKIRCDQREPGCGQCEKRSQSCPGYRNLVDLMFRDESSHVIKKAKARQRRKGMLSPDSSSPEMDDTATNGSITPGSPRVPGQGTLSLFTPSSMSRAPKNLQTKLTWNHDDNLLPSPDDGSWPSTPRIALMYNLAPTFQERGWAFFFSKYVTIDENACHHKFDYIYDVWKPTSLVPDKQLDCVMASMTAVGLVGVATLTQSKDLMDAARKSYGTALCLINAALKDPDEATKDTTMLSILILGLFEMMTDPSAKTMLAWHEHIHGAAALAKMRGVNQFRTAAGVKMFSTLCQTVIMSCVQRQEPMPPLLVHLDNELVKLGVNPGFEVNKPIFRILQIRHDIKTGKLQDSDEIIEQLADIDREFEGILANWPEYMRYKVYRVTTPRKSVYGDQIHRYPSSLNYITWNGIRTCRILVLETLMGEIQSRFGASADPHFADVPQHYINEFCRAKGKLERMVSAIAASTPQHFGLVKPLNSSGEMITEIASVEIREPLNLQLAAAPSPASVTTVSTSSPAFSSPRSLDSAPLYGDSPAAPAILDDGGPTVVDIMRARSLDEEAERYMLLASATDPMVWPLYTAGMASVCKPALKEFVVGRLMAVYEHTGLTQAKRIAQVVRNREVVTSRWTQLPLRPRFDGQRHSLAV